MDSTVEETNEHSQFIYDENDKTRDDKDGRGIRNEKRNGENKLFASIFPIANFMFSIFAFYVNPVSYSIPRFPRLLYPFFKFLLFLSFIRTFFYSFIAFLTTFLTTSLLAVHLISHILIRAIHLLTLLPSFPTSLSNTSIKYDLPWQ